MRGSDTRSEEAKAYRRLYKTAQWKRTRQRQLFIEPRCQRCKRLGFITLASVCHHLDRKKKEDPATFFDGPFESRCKACHDGPEQQAERIGYETTVGSDGWPVDPRHPTNVKSR